VQVNLRDWFSDIALRLDVEMRLGLSVVFARRGPVSSYDGSSARTIE
jgi:hypothetical protein